MEDRHFSLSEVAIGLRVSERTVRRWIKSGKLKAYKPGRDFRIPESAVKELVEKGEVSPKARAARPLEPSLFNDVLGDERPEAIYGPWLALVNRYADRWEAQIAAGAFNLGSLDEFDKVTDDLLETLSPLGLKEKRAQPADYPYSFGPITGEAIARIFALVEPMMAAAAEKYPEEVLRGDDLEPLRRKRDDARRVLERGA